MPIPLTPSPSPVDYTGLIFEGVLTALSTCILLILTSLRSKISKVCNRAEHHSHVCTNPSNGNNECGNVIITDNN